MNYSFVEKTKVKKFTDVIAGEIFYDSNDSGECFMKLAGTLYSSNREERYNVINIYTGTPEFFFDSDEVVELNVSCEIQVALERS